MNRASRRVSRLAMLLVVVLAAAACGGEDTDDTDAADTTAAAEPTTAAPSTTSTPSDEDQTTTTPPASTTTATPETTTTIQAAPGTLGMIRVVFEPTTFVLISNVGGTPIDLGEHWLCQRPSYTQLPSMELQPGDAVAVGFDGEPPSDLVGITATFDLEGALGSVTRDDGELGLYTAASFDDAAAIVDYVQWGSAGHGRESVAVGAGIWTEGAFVEVPIEATSISSSGLPGTGFDDWFADVGG